MKCTKCENELNSGAKFCPICGTETRSGTEYTQKQDVRGEIRRCKNCGAVIDKTNAFCPQCGAGTAAAPYSIERNIPKKKKEPLLVVMIVLIAVICIAIAVTLFIVFRDDDTSAIPEPTQTLAPTPSPTAPPTPAPTATPAPTPDKKAAMASKKAQYMNRLKDIQIHQDNTSVDGSMYDMRQILTGFYNDWDKELNDIYQYLMVMLPSDRAKKLSSEELRWIEYKENKANTDAAQYGDSSMAAMEHTSSLVQSTKERCYVLLEYFD